MSIFSPAALLLSDEKYNAMTGYQSCNGDNPFVQCQLSCVSFDLSLLRSVRTGVKSENLHKRQSLTTFKKKLLEILCHETLVQI